MMKNYSIRRMGSDPDDVEYFGILEHRTNQVVMTCDNALKAQIIKTSLNNGSGFDGWTPSFIIKNNFRKSSGIDESAYK